ncbi:unnamed protein product [Blepharisma stoltei]|uniref:Kinesin-like protein n=1 Tax=Blepharisma stoltei TaxID=1481888 RepID=A0AAU9JQZ4_9CILI|nr:unnamed protein product [Blepharisma stoltei]
MSRNLKNLTIRTSLSQTSDLTTSQNTARSTSIKVIGRFRPLIDFEMSLSENKNLITFISDQTVSIGLGKDTESFTLDHIFTPQSTQSEVYELLGKPTIEDVLSGYNGTIFAYGQTGSGKTHTMMGKDIFDEEFRGVIPRAASQIFETVNSDYGEVEYTLKCSMLEIYKETLRDLLQHQHVNLKIKQCPRRGIYVHGLTEVCITSEKDMLEVLALGEQMRTVASTRLNSTSSRSHLIFITEVSQKLPNDSEKKGKLNLIDLAGSENVNRSGVTGNKLEEAKKINLSLSALGNVIHALISNSDHIPYRDSKLTRLLQESLGGNYKTTLIVACSPSPRSQEETLNTLKFAMRAKNIQNKVSINFKNSPDSINLIIEQLKLELSSARSEIQMLRAEKESTTSCTDTKSSVCQSPAPIRSYKSIETPESKHKRPNSGGDLKVNVCLEDLQISTEDTVKKIPFSIYEGDSLQSSFIVPQERTSDDYFFPSPGCEKIPTVYENYERELERLRKKVNMLKKENSLYFEKISELEKKLAKSKEKQLKAEQKAHEYYEHYHKSMLLINKDAEESRLLKQQNEHATLQINKLAHALQDLDQRYKAFIENSKNMKESTCIEFDEISESSLVKDASSIVTDETLGDINITTITKYISIDQEKLLSQNHYTSEIKSAIEENAELSKDFAIFQLKNQVVQASMINSNMTRSIYSLEWKLELIKHKYEVKRNLCKHQQEQIKALEEMIDYLHDSFLHIAKLSELGEPNPCKMSFNTENLLVPKPVILKPFTPRPSKKYQTPRNKKTFAEHCEKSSELSICSYIETESQEPLNLTMKSKALETSLEMQRLYNTELKKSNELNKNQAAMYQKLLNDFEQKILLAQKNERERWKLFFSELKNNCEKELARKQSEVINLNKLLGEWIHKFMELQESVQLDKKPLSKTSFAEIKNLVNQTLNLPMQTPMGLKRMFYHCPLRQSLSTGENPHFKPTGDKSPL